MTSRTLPIRGIFSRFFPRKYTALPQEAHQGWQELPNEQKEISALHFLNKGELALLQGNLNALSFFETAAQIAPENPKLWYRQGLAFFEYGSEEGKEKALLVASKHFKIAAELNPSYFEAYHAWGNSLLQLGKFHAESHFFYEAKEKYQKALELSSDHPKEVIAELYWDLGIAWSEIAKVSGEALDLSLAIEAFQKTIQLDSHPSPELLKDFGKAYLEMGLLINDSRLYSQAITHLQKAVHLAPQYVDGWMSLAESYSQLYLNTMNERYVAKAADAYASTLRIAPKDVDAWLGWAQILAESGKLTSNAKLIQLSIEKCARAATLDPKDPLIMAQWIESLSYLGAITSRLDLLIEAENKILKATDQYPDDPDLWLAYGTCLMGFGRYHEDPDYYEMAIEKLQWGLSIDRTSAEHWHALATAHANLGNLLCDGTLLERASRFFARAQDLKPSYPALIFDSAVTSAQFSHMAEDLSSLEKAIRLFESLLQNYKDSIIHHPEWLFEYASSLEWLGDFSGEQAHYFRAIEIFSHVLLIHPDFPEIHRHIANCYLEIGNLALEPEYYKKAIHYFRLASRQDEENDSVWLDWGICLIYLAEQTFDTNFRDQLFYDAEQKLIQAGQFGNPQTCYHLACLYSILERPSDAMTFLQKALDNKALPSLDEMAHDEWLDNLRETEAFTHFFTTLEEKLHQVREE